jgi:hypothetical protein
MAIPECPVPDRRTAQRARVQLGCQIIFMEREFDALIRDIAPGGAFLWSGFLPPADADISIKIETALVKVPLILKGTVLRREWKETEKGNVGAFAVEFKDSSPALIEFISKLANPQIL